MRHTLIFTLLLILCLTACSEKINQSEITVALSTDHQPFMYAQSDSLRGLERDLLTMLSERLKVPFTFHRFGSITLLDNFHKGDYDIAISGITITEPRRDVFDFSIPYYDATQVILAKVEDGIVLDSLSAVSKYQVGTLNNSSSLLFVEEELIKMSRLPASNLRKYSSQQALLSAIKSNEVKLIFLEQGMADLLLAENNLEIIHRHHTSEQYGIVLKQNSSLTKHIDKALARILASPQWQEALKKHLVK